MCLVHNARLMMMILQITLKIAGVKIHPLKVGFKINLIEKREC